MRFLLLLLLPMTLAGCATVSTTKTIQVTPPPGVDHIVVDTNATARCKDIFFIITCRVNLEMTPAGGMETPHTTDALTTPTVEKPVVSSTATTRLEELDSLKSQRLINAKEYKTKRDEILRGL